MNEATKREFTHLKIHTQYSICEGALRILDLAIDSENSRAPHKLFESHRPTAFILFILQYFARSEVLTAPSHIEYCVWIFR